MSSLQAALTPKQLGAFYTPDRVAEFLTNWAIRDRSDRVLDPSAGEGVFLRAAHRRFEVLGGNAIGQIMGVELSPVTLQTTSALLATLQPQPVLVQSDFFDVHVESVGLVNAVVGNPPFIRYQRFAGANRAKALRRAEDAGVRLSELSSSWAPFLVHAATFVAPGGRMAMVAPAEIAHASYAQPVVRYLCGTFSRVKVLSFGRRLFPELGEDTVLVLAEGRGAQFQELTVHDVADAEALASIDAGDLKGGKDHVTSGWRPGVSRFVEHFLPKATRELYAELADHPAVVRLGSLADVGIGYVTGNNDFFHLSAEDVDNWRVPKRALAMAIRNGRRVRGLTYSTADWHDANKMGEKNWLLRMRSNGVTVDEATRAYLEMGEYSGVPKAYKCRVRDPWYVVPHVHLGDAFLTYMSGVRPKLFLNAAGAVAPNTLHVVRMKPGAMLSPRQLVASWFSSVTDLSCEVEGHSLGGGMLKLEPRESAGVRVAALSVTAIDLHEWDRLARHGKDDVVRAEVDRRVANVIGLSHREVSRLSEGAQLLRRRRTGR